MFDYSFFDKIYDRTNTSSIKYTDLPESENGTEHPCGCSISGGQRPDRHCGGCTGGI